MRHDLYRNAHKGLRRHLFDVAVHAARTDFAAVEEVASAAEAVRALLADLEHHATVEDGFIMPELRRLAPDVHHDLAADHAHTEGLQRQLGEVLARLTSATREERESLGRRLLEQVNALVAEHLRHMAMEEGAANRVLWAHFSDEELKALQQRIAGASTPAQTAAWLAHVLPAVNRPERLALVAMVRAALPAPAFAEVTAPARRALGPALWAETLAA